MAIYKCTSSSKIRKGLKCAYNVMCLCYAQFIIRIDDSCKIKQGVCDMKPNINITTKIYKGHNSAKICQIKIANHVMKTKN